MTYFYYCLGCLWVLGLWGMESKRLKMPPIQMNRDTTAALVSPRKFGAKGLLGRIKKSPRVSDVLVSPRTRPSILNSSLMAQFGSNSPQAPLLLAPEPLDQPSKRNEKYSVGARSSSDETESGPSTAAEEKKSVHKPPCANDVEAKVVCLSPGGQLLDSNGALQVVDDATWHLIVLATLSQLKDVESLPILRNVLKAPQSRRVLDGNLLLRNAFKANRLDLVQVLLDCDYDIHEVLPSQGHAINEIAQSIWDGSHEWNGEDVGRKLPWGKIWEWAVSPFYLKKCANPSLAFVLVSKIAQFYSQYCLGEALWDICGVFSNMDSYPRSQFIVLILQQLFRYPTIDPDELESRYKIVIEAYTLLDIFHPEDERSISAIRGFWNTACSSDSRQDSASKLDPRRKRQTTL